MTCYNLQIMQNIAKRYNKKVLLDVRPPHSSFNKCDYVINFNLFSVSIGKTLFTPLYINHQDKDILLLALFPSYGNTILIRHTFNDLQTNVIKIMQIKAFQTIDYLLSLEGNKNEITNTASYVT